MNDTDLLDLRFFPKEGMMTPRAYYNRTYTDDFDFARYRDGGMLTAILRNSENWILHSGENRQFCPETIAYWADLGLKKELVSDPAGDYIVFTPLSAARKGNRHRRYPLIFTISGDNSDLYAVETLGFTHLAAQEELIQVIPVVSRPGPGFSIERDRPFDLVAKLVDCYPVDASRIYMTGFSHGGLLAQWNTISHPDCFAGMAAAGIRPGDGAPRRNWPTFMPQYDYPVSGLAAHLHVPVVYCAGLCEQPVHFPLYRGNPTAPFTHSVDENVLHLNYIAQLNHLQPYDENTLFACRDSIDPCERAVGLPLRNTRVETIFGARHYIGDVPSQDGMVRTRLIAVENQPHMPSAAWAALSWQFLRHWRRDSLTHAAIFSD